MKHAETPRLTPLPRLDSKIAVDPQTGCWLWQGCKHPSGYGKAYYNGKVVYAHRLVYELVAGTIPQGKDLDHLCGLRNCVNPRHLEPVSHRENVLRGKTFVSKQAAKTECLRGHPFTEENTYTNKGHRICRRCAAMHAAAENAKRADCPVCGKTLVARYVKTHMRLQHSTHPTH